MKLQTMKKAKPPNDWVVSEEKSLTLKEPAARQLLTALKKHLAVAEQDGSGQFIAIRVQQGRADIGTLDSDLVAKAVVNILGQRDIIDHLADQELSTELLGALRTQVRVRELRSAIADLQTKLDANVVDEEVYQQWCNKHS